ncbi:pseudouridine synthase [Corynebacterium breve]|uniref:RNA pseudouridylate synthase n=1 Tax=Corynebacterium breve TaxID=3049799 RepID=A0ABY8VE07_9CORY|nr:pseudouridine synthase [Corynebacterium breve]WIM67572.1 pseudouridine synthase [Corynebacterium breve]
MVAPIPLEEKATAWSMIASKFMTNKLVRSMNRKKSTPNLPLPPRDGLGATRARVPQGSSVLAGDFIAHLVSTQRHRHPDDDADAVLRRFAAGEVVLRDGTPLTPESVVAPETDVFFYRRPAPEKHVPYEISIVYEDSDILVAHKPPFLATMPRAAHITETAVVRLRRATGNEELTPAHRLDRMTSGLLLMTKRREIRGAYQELFAHRQVHKLYEAIAAYRRLDLPARWEHHIAKEHGEIAATLVRDAEPNSFTNVLAVDEVDPSPFSVHAPSGRLARYILQPITGKTHQLRIQMLAAGVPILGDPVYPEVRPFGDEDYSVPMCLSSVSLAFVDPLSGQPRSFHTTGFSGLPIPEVCGGGGSLR